MMPNAKEDKPQLLPCPTPPITNIQLEPVGEASFPNLDLLPDPNLVAKGWKRRFMADSSREEEAIRLYKELGFEVCSVSVKPSELSEICGDCRLLTCSAYTTIYTRKSPSRNKGVKIQDGH